MTMLVAVMPSEKPKERTKAKLPESIEQAFAEAAELLADQPRKMAESFREFGKKYDEVSKKINHGIRRTNGRIG